MSKVPEELTPLIRQYKRTCDDELVTALHLGKTLDYIESLKLENAELKNKLEEYLDQYELGLPRYEIVVDNHKLNQYQCKKEALMNFIHIVKRNPSSDSRLVTITESSIFTSESLLNTIKDSTDIEL